MFTIAVLEKEEQKRKVLKDILIKNFFELDIEFLWFTTDNCYEKVDKYSQRIQVACISLDMPHAPDFGRRLYEANPQCLICYYSGDKPDIRKIIKSRPISLLSTTKSFYSISQLDDISYAALEDSKRNQFVEENNRVRSEFQSIIADVFREKGIFIFSTRKTSLHTPIRNISYFQSDLKHVVIHYCDGGEDRIFCKLRDVEDSLKESGCLECFIRTHKSYLINGNHCIKVDKSLKTLIMSDHTIIPISESQYQKVLVKLEGKKPFEAE